MADIMDTLHSFVPMADSSTDQVECQVFSKVLYGGDQLTVERGRGAQRCRRNHTLPVEQLKGLVPAIADWHAKQCLLQVYVCKYNEQI